MDKIDIIRKHIGNDDFYDMNGTSMLTNILNAMEEYKEQEVKNYSIPDVSECVTWTTDEVLNIIEENEHLGDLRIFFTEHGR